MNLGDLILITATVGLIVGMLLGGRLRDGVWASKALNGTRMLYKDEFYIIRKEEA